MNFLKHQYDKYIFLKIYLSERKAKSESYNGHCFKDFFKDFLWFWGFIYEREYIKNETKAKKQLF